MIALQDRAMSLTHADDHSQELELNAVFKIKSTNDDA